MNSTDKSLKMHEKHRGKWQTATKVAIDKKDDLAWAYTPGVAQPCKAIVEHPDALHRYTNRGNTIAVVTDGSAVLGLGDIGPRAAMPVMEGKAVLFKRFADVDAVPICLDIGDIESFIATCKALEPSFAGFNLEDIAAPACYTILERLDAQCDIPVFHDDQDGTAIVTVAALINAAKIRGTPPESLKVVLCGTGAAGTAIASMLSDIGVRVIYGYNKNGVLDKHALDPEEEKLHALLDAGVFRIPPPDVKTLAGLMCDVDVFIGVSAGGLLTKPMIRGMAEKPIVFALANPEPEISYEDAKKAGASVVGTGRSDAPNQINNVLAFPGVFRGALDAEAKRITLKMKRAAAVALADVLEDHERTAECIIPSVFDERVVKAVSKAVRDHA